MGNCPYFLSAQGSLDISQCLVTLISYIGCSHFLSGALLLHFVTLSVGQVILRMLDF